MKGWRLTVEGIDGEALTVLLTTAGDLPWYWVTRRWCTGCGNPW
jgi:hypothetical protein